MSQMTHGFLVNFGWPLQFCPKVAVVVSNHGNYSVLVTA